MSKIIDGKAIAAAKRLDIKQKVDVLRGKGIELGLAVIIVGDDSASKTYVNNKKKACLEVGISSYEYALDANTTQEQLIELIDKLNEDDKINGILCQLPLPSHLNEKDVIDRIDPKKDVDAFSPVNVGHIMSGDYTFLPCTPAGIMEMFRYEGVQIQGKHCVIIGRSNIVGKPMAMLMLKENATVTICHSKTERLSDITKQADILIAAVGIPKFVKADMIKQGAIVIDVGMDRDENGRLCGDVDFFDVEPLASMITPVPGGVGPMTISMLLDNVIRCIDI